MAEAKREAIQIARELHYDVETMLRIQNATTENEINRALASARMSTTYCKAK